MLPSATELVARYLRTNGYHETLNSFIKEAGLSIDTGANSTNTVTIEQILQEKKTFDLSLSFEKLGVEEGDTWHSPSPSAATTLSSLPTTSNILFVGMLNLVLPGSTEPRPIIAAATADRRLSLLDPITPSFPLCQSYSQLQDSPILDLITINSKYLLAASMSGKLILFDTSANKVLSERKDHSKYLVKIAHWMNGNCGIIATAGWDSKIFLYRLDLADMGVPTLGEPFATTTLQSIPETVTFISAPGESLPVLLLARRDSTFLYYYTVPSPSSTNSTMTLLGKQNLAPHSNAWVAFSPSDVQLCPTDSSIVAVATSSTPHMKLLLVRLLVPPRPSANVSGHRSEQAPNTQTSAILDTYGTTAHVTQASQARAELLIQDREEAAILININTMSPQTNYSTPKLAWRPDGSGIFVSSDDGIIRGFEAGTGKLIASLDAHDPGSKVRCLSAGYLKEASVNDLDKKPGREFLISGGFDRKLILWHTI